MCKSVLFTAIECWFKDPRSTRWEIVELLHNAGANMQDFELKEVMSLIEKSLSEDFMKGMGPSFAKLRVQS